MKKIVVVGSSNTDMVTISEKLPAPGETVIGKKFFSALGGKGANQAVAAQRLGGQVTFVAKVGTDAFGKQALETYRQEGLDTSFITCDKNNASGIALITVDAKGENAIVVAPGANALLSAADIDNTHGILEQTDYFLTQLEIPLETVQYLAKKVTALGKKLVLNPAPARTLPDELFSQLHIITPNKSEAEMLTGVQVHDHASAHEAATILQSKGVDIVIITLGEKGAYLHTHEVSELVTAPAVQAVDTTAAGDTFNGALVVALSEGLPLREAVGFANRCAAVSVTREGAQTAIPYRKELETNMHHL